MKYFNDSLNFNFRPAADDYWGLTYNQFLKFLDALTMLIHSKCIEEGIDKRDMVVKSPLHCAVASNGKILVIGLSRNKAIIGSTTFSTIKDKYGSSLDREGLKALISDVSENELGYSQDVFMSLHIKTLQNKLLHESLAVSDEPFLSHFTEKFEELSVELKRNVDSDSFDINGVEELVEITNAWNDISDAVNEFVNNIKKRVNLMDVKPKFKARDIVVKENQAFYVLPFTDGPLNAYEAVKERMVTSKEVECNIIKSEDTFDPSRGNNIVENIWQDICTSRFVIADLSEKNPNVFYELGICDTLGKTVISICSNRSRDEDYGGKLPFDIAGDYTIFYDEDYKGIKLLQDQLEQRISAILNNSVVKTN